jgi:hypothetical protein
VIAIQGEFISQASARWLVDRLRAVGRADDVTAAWAIEQSLNDDLVVPELEEAESDAVLALLSDAPAGLVNLRNKLFSDLRNRLV